LIKLPFSQAKKLGFAVKEYVFLKDKSTPQPVIEKSCYKQKKSKSKKKNTVPLKQQENIFKLDFAKD
jgi:hypothetical protein